MGCITISTSESLDIDNTYIETPTVTDFPVSTLTKSAVKSRSFKEVLLPAVSSVFNKGLFGSGQVIFSEEDIRQRSSEDGVQLVVER